MTDTLPQNTVQTDAYKNLLEAGTIGTVGSIDILLFETMARQAQYVLDLENAVEKDRTRTLRVSRDFFGFETGPTEYVLKWRGDNLFAFFAGDWVTPFVEESKKALLASETEDIGSLPLDGVTALKIMDMVAVLPAVVRAAVFVVEDILRLGKYGGASVPSCLPSFDNIFEDSGVYLPNLSSAQRKEVSSWGSDTLMNLAWFTNPAKDTPLFHNIIQKELEAAGVMKVPSTEALLAQLLGIPTGAPVN